MKNYVYILFFLFSFFCFSQKEASKWLFGEKVGLQFLNLSDPPLVLRGELNTLEGCASISDNDGNLLFYSDGSTVWDKNDDIMPNGTDLLGDESSTQSAIIIPKPLDPDIYYLFTVGSTIVPSGYNYYTIDMSLNGGLGEVVGGNVNLTDGHGGSDWSEKITAVQGGECNTFWVISLVQNLYYSYKVDENGVDPNPIISPVDFLAETSRGYLKVSPDGTKIVAAHQGNDEASNGCFLYSFNNQTGQVINDEISLFPNSIDQPYGVEFSSQGNKLYVSTYEPNANVYKLFQFSLETTNVLNSKVLIHTESPAFRGGLQLGPDLKIYVTIPEEYTVGTNYLDVIHNPELDGAACDFEEDYIFFGSDSYSMQGLPPFIQSFFYTQKINIVNPYEPITSVSSNLSLCEGFPYTLEGPEIQGADYLWTLTADGITTILPTPSPPHQLTINNTGNNILGTYELVVTSLGEDCDIQYFGEADVSYTTPPNINSLVFLNSCDFFDSDSTDGTTTFNLNNSIYDITHNYANADVYFYLNDSDAVNDTYNQNSLPEFFNNTSPNQIITTKVYENDSNCYGLGQLVLNATPSEALHTPNYNNCEIEDGVSIFNLSSKREEIKLQNGLPPNSELLFFTSIEDALANTNTIEENYESSGGPIYYYVINNGSCLGSGSFNLVVNPLPPINKDDVEIEACEFNFPLVINSSIPYTLQQNYFFEWSNGSLNNEISIQDEQNLTVNVIDKITGCEISKSYQITKTTPPIITDIDVNIDTRTVTVYTPENINLSFILDNPNGIFQQENVFLNVSPGIHNVYVSNECGVSQREIYVLGFPKFFTPNDDGMHDTWKVKGLETARYSISDIQIFDRYGKLLKILRPNEQWNGIFNGEKLPPTDYWFKLNIRDSNAIETQFTGHFSLVQ